MTFLLDEIALATARLAEAGVPSPRTDAEEIAAFVHGVRRSELHTVKDADFDALFWEGVATARGPRAAAAHHRPRLLPLPGARGRARRVRAAPRDRGHGGLGHRDAARDGRRRAPGRRPRHRLRRDRAVHRPGGRARPRCTPSRSTPAPTAGPSATSPSTARAASTCTRTTWPTPCPSSTARSTWSSPTRPTSRPARSRATPRCATTTRTRALYGTGRRRPRRGHARSNAPPAGCCAPAAGSSVEHADEQGRAVYLTSPRTTAGATYALPQDLTRRDRFVTARLGQD